LANRGLFRAGDDTPICHKRSSVYGLLSLSAESGQIKSPRDQAGPLISYHPGDGELSAGGSEFCLVQSTPVFRFGWRKAVMPLRTIRQI